MRQLLYISSSRPRGQQADVSGILEQSRHNNALDGVSGLLWTDGIRFLQVLEGEWESVQSTFTRIRADRRHEAIETLSDRFIEQREFGGWSMAEATGDVDKDRYSERLTRLLDGASDSVRQTFLDLIEAREGLA